MHIESWCKLDATPTFPAERRKFEAQVEGVPEGEEGYYLHAESNDCVSGSVGP